MLIKSSGITDVGLKRERNEDSFSIDENVGLYVVADGMGGHRAGEIASRTAVDLINKSFREWAESGATEDMLFGKTDRSLSLAGNYVLSGVRLANRVIYELSAERSEYRGMGTTVAVLAVAPTLVIAANVGDSRIYMVRDGRIERLSKDHTVVAEQLEMGIMSDREAQSSSLKHILTRNLGSSEQLDAEVYEVAPVNGDRYLLCSDGITDLIDDEEILGMVEEADDPERLCRGFVDEALKRGGHDNATVVSVFLSGLGGSGTRLGKKVGGFMADLLASFQKAVRIWRS